MCPFGGLNADRGGLLRYLWRNRFSIKLQSRRKAGVQTVVSAAVSGGAQSRQKNDLIGERTTFSFNYKKPGF